MSRGRRYNGAYSPIGNTSKGIGGRWLKGEDGTVTVTCPSSKTLLRALSELSVSTNAPIVAHYQHFNSAEAR